MAADAQTATRICRVLLGLAVLWAFIGLVGRESWADDDEIARATLRGVEGVTVVVNRLDPEVERLGLTKQQLQTDVELQLRKVGIPVLTREEQGKTPDYSWLYVDVHVLLRPELPLAIYHINIELRQL